MKSLEEMPLLLDLVRLDVLYKEIVMCAQGNATFGARGDLFKNSDGHRIAR